MKGSSKSEFVRFFDDLPSDSERLRPLFNLCNLRSWFCVYFLINLLINL